MTRIAFLGPAGTFTDSALSQLSRQIGRSEETEDLLAAVAANEFERVPAESPAAAIEAVRAHEVDGACVPIENSVDGTVVPTADSLIQGPRVQVLAETEIDIAFDILVAPGTPAEAITTVHSHPTALAQIKAWVAENLPRATLVASESTAAAARLVAERAAAAEADGQGGAGKAAAAAPRRAGEIHGLDSLASGVVDVDSARTRFLLVGRPQRPQRPTSRDRTSLVVWLPNEPGSLVDTLNEFSSRGIDLTRVESRPTRSGLGTYYFHIDCIGHVDHPLLGEALRAVYRRADSVRFLGSWPTVQLSGSEPPSVAASLQWYEELRNPASVVGSE